MASALILDLLQTAATRRGGATAIRFGAQALSYEAFLGEISRASRALAKVNIGKGACVAFLSENRLELMTAYYAAAGLGAVFVPINPSLTAREVAHIIVHSGAQLLFHDEAMLAVAEGAAPAAIRRPIAALTGDAPGSEGSVRERSTALEDDFLIIYTSGSTGTPKAVLFDQQAEIQGNAALIAMWDITEADVTLVALPLGFLYGLSTAAATGLQAGGEVVILRRFHPGEVLQAMASNRASIYHGVPTMFTMMLDYAEQNGLSIDLSFMRLLICAGAPLSAELKSRFARRFNKAIDDYYALTEVRPVFGRFAKDSQEVPSGAIGRASPGAVIRVVDAKGGDVADGEQGELLVRAPATLKRYFKDEAMTQASLQDGLFRTGDLGFRDSRGFYHLTGRIKDIIIRGGANIAPAEVEGVIARFPGVQSAAVIGVADRKYGEVPVAFIVSRAGERVTAEALAVHCRHDLADYKVPAAFHFLQAFPLGVTGKVDKKALKALWRAWQG
jgi:long-chain acyl-CoA synthetase